MRALQSCRRLSFVLSLAVALAAGASATPAAPRIHLVGWALPVDDLGSAIDFYTRGLGFTLKSRDGFDSAVLEQGTVRLALRRAAPAEPRHAAGAGARPVFRTLNMKRTIEALGRYGARVLENRPFPTADGSNCVTLADPWGHQLRLLEPRPRPDTAPPVLLGFEAEVSDLSRAQSFYGAELGFPAIAEEADPPGLRIDGAGAGLSLWLRLAPEAGGDEGRAALLIEAAGGADRSPFPAGAARILDPFGNSLVFAPRRPTPPSHSAAGRPPRAAAEPFVLTPGTGPPVAAELRRISVPENRRHPTGRTVEIAFVRLASTAKKPGPPIVYLAGGPGGSGIAAARGNRLPLFLALRQIADVIALDPRGVGLSQPDLACNRSWSSPLDQPSDRARILALAREHSAACARALEAAGIDLGGYNTDELADDLEDLRRALRVPRLSLLGISYGTHLALAALRRHEGSFHAAVLAGVEGPDQVLRRPSEVEARLQAVGTLAGSDLAGALRRLLAGLEQKPATVEIEVPLAQSRAPVTVGRLDLQWMVLQSLGSREGIEKLPASLQAMERGDWSALALFAWNARRGWLGSAMPYAVQCASGVSPQRWARIEAERRESVFTDSLDFPFPEICPAWHVPDLGPAFRAPVRAALPALFIHGTLDTRTPLPDAREAGRLFPRGHHLILDGAVHGDDLLLASPEIGQRIVRFFATGQARDETIVLPPLRFDRP